MRYKPRRLVTDGLGDAVEPVFDAGGKYLYFLASTDAGPVNQWFSQAGADMRLKRSLYVAVLRKGVPSPFAKESDEEKAADDKKPDAPKPDPAKPRPGRRSAIARSSLPISRVASPIPPPCT